MNRLYLEYRSGEYAEVNIFSTGHGAGGVNVRFRFADGTTPKFSREVLRKLIKVRHREYEVHVSNIIADDVTLKNVGLDGKPIRRMVYAEGGYGSLRLLRVSEHEKCLYEFQEFNTTKKVEMEFYPEEIIYF